jgi:hypothetical protein
MSEQEREGSSTPRPEEEEVEAHGWRMRAEEAGGDADPQAIRQRDEAEGGEGSP